MRHKPVNYKSFLYRTNALFRKRNESGLDLRAKICLQKKMESRINSIFKTGIKCHKAQLVLHDTELSERESRASSQKIVGKIRTGRGRREMSTFLVSYLPARCQHLTESMIENGLKSTLHPICWLNTKLTVS